MLEISDKSLALLRKIAPYSAVAQALVDEHPQLESGRLNFIEFKAEADGSSCIATYASGGKNASWFTPRTYARVSRLITGIFKDRFTASEIAAFTEKLRLTFIANVEISVVSGEAIRHAYYEGNYIPGYGSLASSCMRTRAQQRNLDFYVYNPETIQLVQLANNAGKIGARALLFHGATITRRTGGKHVCPEGSSLLSRIYYNGNYYQALLDFVKANNLAHAYLNDNHFLARIDKDYESIGAISSLKIEIPLEVAGLNYYPYMDRGLCYIDLKRKVLSNVSVAGGLQTSQGSHSLSRRIKPFDDPHRPGQVWAPHSGDWIRDTGDLVWTRQGWKKGPLPTCRLCGHGIYAPLSSYNKVYLKDGLVPAVEVCAAHSGNELIFIKEKLYALRELVERKKCGHMWLRDDAHCVSYTCSTCGKGFYTARIRGEAIPVCSPCQRRKEAAEKRRRCALCGEVGPDRRYLKRTTGYAYLESYLACTTCKPRKSDGAVQPTAQAVYVSQEKVITKSTTTPDFGLKFVWQ